MSVFCKLFDDPEYSDLTLQLSDGRKFRVHKLIICKNCKYFDRLCGSTGHYEDREKSVIELQGDDPDAVEQILRSLYGCALPRTEDETWHFWFNLAVAADKYLGLEHGVGQAALSAFRESALAVENVHILVDILMMLDEPCAFEIKIIGTDIRRDKLAKLLRDRRYCEWLASDEDALLTQLGEIANVIEGIRRPRGTTVYVACDR